MIWGRGRKVKPSRRPPGNVTYTRDPHSDGGKAVIQRGKDVIREIELEKSIPHNYTLAVEIDGKDVWVGTSKGLGWAIGDDYYPALKKSSNP